MSEAWFNFAVVVAVQLVLLLGYAAYTKQLSTVPRSLCCGALLGVIVGIPFDLIVGELIGLHAYVLGFGLAFLIVNAALSFGFFVASVLLLCTMSWLRFCFTIACLMVIYEITNYFFTVWSWGFILPPGVFMVVLLVGYIAGATVAAVLSHRVFEYRFSWIDSVTSR